MSNIVTIRDRLPERDEPVPNDTYLSLDQHLAMHDVPRVRNREAVTVVDELWTWVACAHAVMSLLGGPHVTSLRDEWKIISTGVHDGYTGGWWRLAPLKDFRADWPYVWADRMRWLGRMIVADTTEKRRAALRSIIGLAPDCATSRLRWAAVRRAGRLTNPNIPDRIRWGHLTEWSAVWACLEGCSGAKLYLMTLPDRGGAMRGIPGAIGIEQYAGEDNGWAIWAINATLPMFRYWKLIEAGEPQSDEWRVALDIAEGEGWLPEPTADDMAVAAC